MNRVFLTIPKGADRKTFLEQTLKNLKKKRAFLYSLTDNLAVAFENPPSPDMFAPFAVFAKLAKEKQEFFSFGTTNVTGRTLLVTLRKDSEGVYCTELPPEAAALAAAISDAGFPSECFFPDSDTTAKQLAEKAKKELEGSLEFVRFVPVQVTTDELTEELGKLEKIDLGRTNRLLLLALVAVLTVGVAFVLKNRSKIRQRKQNTYVVAQHTPVKEHKPAVQSKEQGKAQQTPITPTVPVGQLADLLNRIGNRAEWFRADDRSALVIVSGTSCPSVGRERQKLKRFVAGQFTMCDYPFKPELRQRTVNATPVMWPLKGRNIADLLSKLKGAQVITGVRRGGEWQLMALPRKKPEKTKNSGGGR